MDTHRLSDLRVAIEDTVHAVMEESGSGVAQNHEVLARLKSERRSLVSFFSPQLVDIALVKLLNDVCRKRTALVSGGDKGDLFGGYGRIPKRVTVARGLKKYTANLTLAEAKKWLDDHSNRTVDIDNEDFRKLVDECEHHAHSDDETIAEIFARLHRGESSGLEVPPPAN